MQAPATWVLRSHWNVDQILGAIEWYADTYRMTVFTRVPVAGPRLGPWSPECPELQEIIAVPAGRRNAGAVREFDPDAFEAAVRKGTPVHPILAIGYADRPCFGYLATRQAFTARTWNPNGPVQPVALTKPEEARTNVSGAYFAAGFDIVPLGGEIPPFKRGGAIKRHQDPWENPKTGEDRTLNALWRSRDKKGWWLAEVAIGTGAPRRIDALVVDWPKPRRSPEGADVDDLRRELAAGREAELIEAKKKLDVATIGQLLCGAQMLADSLPGHGRLTLTAAVPVATDEPLLWFCDRYGIRVEVDSASDQ